MAGRATEEPRWRAREDMRVLAHDLQRVDGPVKVTGSARYTHDVRVPGMLWARVLLCPYPVARATLDLDAARALPNDAERALVLAPGNVTALLALLGGQHVLLAGDIENDAERVLAARDELSPARLVVAPHHGSRSSSTRPAP